MEFGFELHFCQKSIECSNPPVYKLLFKDKLNLFLLYNNKNFNLITIKIALSTTVTPRDDAYLVARSLDNQRTTVITQTGIRITFI